MSQRTEWEGSGTEQFDWLCAIYYKSGQVPFYEKKYQKRGHNERKHSNETMKPKGLWKWKWLNIRFHEKLLDGETTSWLELATCRSFSLINSRCNELKTAEQNITGIAINIYFLHVFSSTTRWNAERHELISVYLCQSRILHLGCMKKQSGSFDTYIFFLQAYAKIIFAMSTICCQRSTNDSEFDFVNVWPAFDPFLCFRYIVERNCDTMQIGGLLDSKQYGIALPPGSPYRWVITCIITI